jgi:DNA-binding LytR/AlgR family response regulator
MKILIIEDEKPAARLLQRKIEKLGLTIETLLHSVSTSIEWFENNVHPDLIFLDIQLSDGLSFEIFEKVTVKSAIIFTTAYDEYALKAFKLNSIDYLLKPIDEDELATAINKFKTNFEAKQSANIDIESLKKILNNDTASVPEFKKRFTIKTGNHLKVINNEEIVCFYSENKGTYLHTKENRNYLLEQTLEQLESELNPKDFFRVSRKFIIYINAIQDIVVYTNSRLKVKLNAYDEDEIIVSRERVNEFKSWLQ